MALVSAHRGGGGHGAENGLAAIEAAVAMGCDFVELDVRLTSDSRAVLSHDDDPHLAGGPVSIAARTWSDLQPAGLLTLDEALAALGDRAGAHVDLKVEDPQCTVARTAVDAVGPERVVVTSSDVRVVHQIAAWASEAAPGLRVGLSTGARDRAGTGSRLVAGAASWFPRARLRHSGADIVAAHHLWARWWLRGWAGRHGFLLLVWTVDDDRGLSRWLADPHTWMVVTNRPEQALRLRSGSA